MNTFTRTEAMELAHGATELIIPQGYTEIDDYALGDSKSLPSNHPFSHLTAITIPSSVTKIGRYAFSWCRNLTSIVIPNGVTEIGAYAFFNCVRLTSITLPPSIISIGRDAFKFCTALTSIAIPQGVTTIHNGTFVGCSSLYAVTLPDSVTAIGKEAFFGQYKHQNKNKRPITIYSPKHSYARKYCGWGIFSKVKWQETAAAPPVPILEEIMPEPEITISADVRFAEFIAELKALRQQTTGEELNKKIDALTSVTNKICEAIAEKPENWRLIDKKIAEYYFPTTLKLIRIYIDAPPQSGELDDVVAGIAPALGGIVSALENRLDTLRKSKSIDVAADINVLNHMLMMDGIELDKKRE